MTSPLIMRDFARQGDFDIKPKDAPRWQRMTQLAVVVAVLTSAGWYSFLLDERSEHRQQIIAEQAASEKLLADAVARMTPIRSLTIQYANGAKAQIAFKERKP